MSGQLVFVGQDAFCVYLNSDSDQECAEGTPYGMRMGATWVCSDDPEPPIRLVETAIFLAQNPQGIEAEDVDALTGSVETLPDGGPTVPTDGDVPLEQPDL